MIELKELTLGYGQRTLLETVNARITGGQLVALLGRNGTGKSTLLRAMMGLEKPQSGEITLQGKNIASLKPEKLARNISFVTTDKVRIANLRCKDVVALGRAPYTNWIGQLQPEDQKRVDDAMQLVGMSGYAEKTMDKMSDGECQRIMIARALAQDTPVILLDEPTAFLDLPNRYELCSLLARLAHDEGVELDISDLPKRPSGRIERDAAVNGSHIILVFQRVLCVDCCVHGLHIRDSARQILPEIQLQRAAERAIQIDDDHAQIAIIILGNQSRQIGRAHV